MTLHPSVEGLEFGLWDSMPAAVPKVSSEPAVSPEKMRIKATSRLKLIARIHSASQMASAATQDHRRMLKIPRKVCLRGNRLIATCHSGCYGLNNLIQIFSRFGGVISFLPYLATVDRKGLQSERALRKKKCRFTWLPRRPTR